MDRWKGKIAVVTGASSGIGAAITLALVRAGLETVGLARRKELIDDLKAEVADAPGTLYAYECDITDGNSIKMAFDWIEKEVGPINILINNAGRTAFKSILDDDDSIEEMKRTLDVNLIGLLACTKAAYNSLKKSGDYGHIVNISSNSAHRIHITPDRLTRYNIYPGSKHALRATSEVLRQELGFLNQKVKISQISPGFVKTEIVKNAGNPHYHTVYDTTPHLMPEDVANACLYILSTPPNVDVHDLMLKPIGEPV